MNGADAAGSDRRQGKSAAAFRTTSEVGDELKIPAHVLRFWESKFSQLKPVRRGGGRRYYRPEDVELLRRIRQCLYQEGYTIRGVQKLLREGALRDGVPAVPPPEPEAAPTLFALEPAPPADRAPPRPPPTRQALETALEEVRRELLAIRELLARIDSG